MRSSVPCGEAWDLGKAGGRYQSIYPLCYIRSDAVCLSHQLLASVLIHACGLSESSKMYTMLHANAWPESAFPGCYTQRRIRIALLVGRRSCRILCVYSTYAISFPMGVAYLEHDRGSRTSISSSVTQWMKSKKTLRTSRDTSQKVFPELCRTSHIQKYDQIAEGGFQTTPRPGP